MQKLSRSDFSTLIILLLTIFWSGVAIAQAPVIVAPKVGALPVPLISTNGPTTILSDGPGVLLTAAPDSGFIYKWMNNGVAIAGATNSSYLAKEGGSYTVSISQNGLSLVSEPVAVTSLFSLPADNFTLKVSGVNCDDSNDGLFTIRAKKLLNYTATITGGGLNKQYPFTDSLTISNLAAGSYSVCITVAGQNEYSSCYTIFITQAQPLSVYSLVDVVTNSVKLSLHGASAYSINLNGVQYKTSQNTITLPLQVGNNLLKVSTDKLCQGTFEKLINSSANIQVYPVPFQNTLFVNLGNASIAGVMIKIYDISGGRMVFASEYTDQSGVMQLDLSELSSGIYTMHLVLNKADHIYKIIKQ